jgi:uncharacterized membrane protein
VFALLAALAYGTSPIMTRTALQFSGPSSAIVGGLIAYGAATVAVVMMILVSTSLRRNVMTVVVVAVAVAQSVLYAALSVAPIMVVIPLLQLSLVFRLVFSMWLNPERELFGPEVIIGRLYR